MSFGVRFCHRRRGSAQGGRWRVCLPRRCCSSSRLCARARPNPPSPTATRARSVLSNSPHQRIRLVHLHGRRRLRSGDAGEAELVPARLAAQRADQDGPQAVRHRLGGLSRIRLEAADRRAVRLSLAADQRDAAPTLAPGRRTFAAYGRQGDRRAFPVDVGTATIRDIAMRMQAGGVGFYPRARRRGCTSTAASVRYWPRMSRDALARLFPDGKTVFIPADGQPMPGYEQARAEIEAARRRSVGRPRRDRIPPPAAGCSPGCSERAAAAPTTRKRAAAAKPRRPAAAAGRRRRRPRERRRSPRRRAPRMPRRAAAGRTRARRRRRRAERQRATPARSADPDRRRFHRPPAAAQARRADPRRRADAAGAPRPNSRLRRPRRADAAGDRDLIAALLERGRLPGVITRGVGAPRGRSGARRDRRARAAGAAGDARLAPPRSPRPFPRSRRARNPARVAAKPAPSETSAAAPAKLAATAARPRPDRPRAGAAFAERQPANPYGDLVYDGFAADAAPSPATATADLRGATP